MKSQFGFIKVRYRDLDKKCTVHFYQVLPDESGSGQQKVCCLFERTVAPEIPELTKNMVNSGANSHFFIVV